MTDTSQHREERHNSPSAIAQIIGGFSSRDWILVAVFAVVTGFYIYDRGQLQTQLSVAQAEREKIAVELRDNTVATDLAKYNAQEVRVQAEVNKQLQAITLAMGAICRTVPGQSSSKN
jgi:hypothetical protein